MDTRTGDIYDAQTVADMRARLLRCVAILGRRESKRILKEHMPAPIAKELLQSLKPMNVDPTPQQLDHKPTRPAAIGRVGRNDPCPCGSKRKFKKCCMKNS